MIVIAGDTQLRLDESSTPRNGLRGIREILADVLAVYCLDEAADAPPPLAEPVTAHC